MTFASAADERIFHSYAEWQQKEEKRVCREWDAEWDGTIAHGAQINDRQCDRIEQARSRLGATDAIVKTGYRTP